MIATTLCLSMETTKVLASTENGPYPTRRGVILVTPDKYKNLIPTGHAAIVWSETQVVESLSDGVGMHSNDWKKRKSKIYGVTVASTNTGQDRTAAYWCKKQCGKKYNFNYLDTKTRKKFYCSHLVWASFLDSFKINLDTSAFGDAVHPMELVNSSKTVTVYTYTR